ncbi:class I mannose-6-phosphate isomerase [Microbacterium sp. BK668]|uniref:class I mannose-6-phosphate isomerase n=1 Tax=Microbacterium sp. BK668 TaxID=2512118 RepID=UPI0010611FA0|nr:class I mannose-6-phosphate isomerase [Microbacterium sp. BK668]TDN87777.1 mannose-6-phosphate isomerase [Microbacterium sp. BK668]
MDLRPIALPANQPAERFYRGGARIARWRGSAAATENTPEDWVASTTTLAGETDVGLTTIAGERLRDLVDADPLGWLGAAHVAAFGSDPRLLVKLLDAGERLPVHAHPDDAFALGRLGRAHGKTEAWFLVEGGTVHLGFVRDVPRVELEAIVEAQDTERLLNLLHARTVEPGDTVFVPAGLPHAIGEGVFLVEVQQPEDLSILLDWRGFDIDGRADGHLGVGFDAALDAVDRRAWTDAEIDALLSRDASAARALVREADPFFRIERASAEERPEIAAGFAVLVILEGEGTLRSAIGDLPHPAVATTDLPLRAGATVILPHAAGDQVLTGTLRGVVCRPPSPS